MRFRPLPGPRRARAALLALALLASSALPAPATPPRQLTIASWNLEWLNRLDHEGKVPRSAADYARLARYARRLDADVVALQEVDGEAAARRVFDPSVYSFHFTRDEDAVQRTGFAFKKTLSITRFPDVVELSVEGSRRGADMAVSLNGRPLRLLNVHLKTGCWEEPLSAGTDACRILRRQLPALEAWVDARSREKVPFAVLGDFNRRFSARDEFWVALDDDGDLTDAARGGTPECWGGAFPHFVDHIVLNAPAAAHLVPGSFREIVYDPPDAAHKATLSDHCPVVITLATGAPAPAATPVTPPVRLEAREASGHAGEIATVCGRVASARYLSSSRRQPTFLNLERPHPDQLFTVVIWGADRPAFGSPEVSLPGKRICVTGKIEIYQGKPEIISTDPAQLVVAEDR